MVSCVTQPSAGEGRGREHVVHRSDRDSACVVEEESIEDGVYATSALLPRSCLFGGGGVGGPRLPRLVKDVLQNAWLEDPRPLWKSVPQCQPEEANR
jgi:hypothetical protein